MTKICADRDEVNIDSFTRVQFGNKDRHVYV